MNFPAVLEINSAEQMGGGEVHFLDLVAGLVQNGLSISAVVRPRSPLIPKLRELSVPVHTLRLGHSLDVVSAWGLRRLSDQLGITILHAHMARDYLIAAAARGKQRRLVLTRHLLLPMRQSLVHRICFRRVDRFIAVSRGVRKALLQHAGVEPSRVVVIPNGVRVERFQSLPGREALRQRLGIPRDAKVVGIVGQISPHKGHEDLVEAAANLAPHYPQAIFLIVGEESENGSFVRTLRARIEQQGLLDKFIFAGFLDDVPSAMGLMNVLAVPSWEEPFGLVVLEAMAAGVPVVATNAGGPQEILKNGVSGLLVAPRAPGELAEAISSLLTDAELAVRLSRAGREEVEKHYSLEFQVLRTADLFSEVAALQ